MKKIAFLLAGFCASLSFAQKVSDYKYVVVPSAFESFKKENYGLSAFLTKALKTKQYTVISENRGQWPAEANSNPCSVLNANVINDSGFLKNKIVVEFTDCNSKTVASYKGSSSIKEFEEGYKDAATKALVSLSNSNPVNTVAVVQETQVSEVLPETTKNVEVNSQAQVQAPSGKVEKFSNGKISVQKIQIDAEQFILAQENSSVPYATLRATAKKDVFRVKLGSGESTVGYYEKGNLVIEVPQSNGDFSNEVFKPL